MLEHGGRLRDAAIRHNIPLHEWIDLSTGINPNGWPVPEVPAECWLRLPEQDDNLPAAARSYYQNPSILPVAGSQAAIQTLPKIRPHSRVGILTPAYAEHAENWRNAGHDLIELTPLDIEQNLPLLDVLVLVNPNNPTGHVFNRDQLLSWHQQLQHRGGWLIIDEAFIDCRPDLGLSGYPVQDGLIVLRSIGKFFGLAGIRCGFVIGAPELLLALEEKLGPWTLSHPTRFVAAAALQDKTWQQLTRQELPVKAQRLRRLLTHHGLTPDGGCELFQWIKTGNAAEIHLSLAQQGILTRLFDNPSALRFGLPQHETHWNSLEKALKNIEIPDP